MPVARNTTSKRVFITGGTGYIGSRLIPLLAGQGHAVVALVRKGSENKLPTGATPVVGDALKMDSCTEQIRGADTFVHLQPIYWLCERLPSTRESARRLGLAPCLKCSTR